MNSTKPPTVAEATGGKYGLLNADGVARVPPANIWYRFIQQQRRPMLEKQHAELNKQHDELYKRVMLLPDEAKLAGQKGHAELVELEQQIERISSGLEGHGQSVRGHIRRTKETKGRH